MAIEFERGRAALKLSNRLLVAVLSLLLSSTAYAVGTISGTVVDAADGTTPVHPVGVSLWDSVSNTWVEGFAKTNNDNGTFEFVNVPEGSFKIFYDAFGPAIGYTDMLYDGVSCYGCPIAENGDILVVVDGAYQANIQMVRQAVLSGRVTNESGIPLAGVNVDLLDAVGNTVKRSKTTSTDGNWSINVPGPGAYYVQTVKETAPGYKPEVWNNVPCDNCDVTVSGTEIVVTSADVAGLDFALTAAFQPDVIACDEIFVNGMEDGFTDFHIDSPTCGAADLLSGVYYEWSIPTRTIRESPVSFTLISGPVGLALDPESGIMTWTPSPEQENQTFEVSLSAESGEQTLSVGFSLRVVPSTPLTLVASDDVYTVDDPGTNLDGLSFSFPAAHDIPGGPFGVVIVSDSDAPSIPAGVTRLGDFFKAEAANVSGEEKIQITFPSLTVPEGYAPEDLLLFIYTSGPHSDGFNWVPVYEGLDYDGSNVQAEVARTGKLMFIGVAAEPAPSSSFRADLAEIPEAGNCEPKTRFGGLIVEDHWDVCKPDLGFPIVEIKDWFRTNNGQTFGGVTRMDIVNHIAEVSEYAESDLFLIGSALITIVIISSKYDPISNITYLLSTCGGAPACVRPETPDTIYVDASAFATNSRGPVAAEDRKLLLKLTLAHEYFHHLHANTKIPGRSNPWVDERGQTEISWLSEGLADFFQYRAMDSQLDFLVGRRQWDIMGTGLNYPASPLRTGSYNPYQRKMFWQLLYQQCPEFPERLPYYLNRLDFDLGGIETVRNELIDHCTFKEPVFLNPGDNLWSAIAQYQHKGVNLQSLNAFEREGDQHPEDDSAVEFVANVTRVPTPPDFSGWPLQWSSRAFIPSFGAKSFEVGAIGPPDHEVPSSIVVNLHLEVTGDALVAVDYGGEELRRFYMVSEPGPLQLIHEYDFDGKATRLFVTVIKANEFTPEISARVGVEIIGNDVLSVIKTDDSSEILDHSEGVVKTLTPTKDIDCGLSCTAALPAGEEVTLLASHSRGYEFLRWADASLTSQVCPGETTNPCTFTLDGDKIANAVFKKPEGLEAPKNCRTTRLWKNTSCGAGLFCDEWILTCENYVETVGGLSTAESSLGYIIDDARGLAQNPDAAIPYYGTNYSVAKTGTFDTGVSIQSALLTFKSWRERVLLDKDNPEAGLSEHKERLQIQLAPGLFQDVRRISTWEDVDNWRYEITTCRKHENGDVYQTDVQTNVWVDGVGRGTEIVYYEGAVNCPSFGEMDAIHGRHALEDLITYQCFLEGVIGDECSVIQATQQP